MLLLSIPLRLLLSLCSNFDCIRVLETKDGRLHQPATSIVGICRGERGRENEREREREKERERKRKREKEKGRERERKREREKDKEISFLNWFGKSFC